MGDSVLGIIAVIIIPQVASTLNNSRTVALEKQIHVLQTATEKWGNDHLYELPEIDSPEIVSVDFRTLYTDGEITSYPVENPKDGGNLTGCILINYNSQYKQYEYKYSADTYYCDIHTYKNIFGDLDGDLVVNGTDLNILKNHPEWISDDLLKYLADLNLDNVIDNTDATILERYLAGEINKLPITK